MSRVVSHTTVLGKPPRCIFSNTAVWPSWRRLIVAEKIKHRLTFIRQWRHHRGYSLDQLAARVPMDKGNLSKIERGLLPYNQDLLEHLADALMTDVASLLIRDPTQHDAIWSIWDRASLGERAQIESVAAALVSAQKRA